MLCSCSKYPSLCLKNQASERFDLTAQWKDGRSVDIKRNDGNVEFKVCHIRYPHLGHHRQAEGREAEEDNERGEIKHTLIWVVLKCKDILIMLLGC